MTQLFKSQILPLAPNINVEFGRVLLSKVWNVANNIDLGGEGFFTEK